ncbi:MAG: glycosyltransferase family 9 protein [Devosia sp.]
MPAGLPAGIAQQLAENAFAQSQWREAWGYYLAALQSGEAVVDLARCLLFGARCALYMADFVSAIQLLTTYTEAFPTESEGYFYLGRALQGAHRDLDALTALNAASLLSPGKPKYLAALAQTAHSLAFGGFGYAADANEGTYAGIAAAALKASLAKDPDHIESLTEAMLLALDTGELDRAIGICRKVTEKEAKHGRDRARSVTSTLALALARGGHDSHIARIEYLSTYATGRRILARVKGPAASKTAAPARKVFKILAPEKRLGTWGIETLEDKFRWVSQRAVVDAPSEAISLEFDMVCPVRPTEKVALRALAAKLDTLPEHFAGVVEWNATTNLGSRTPADLRALLIRKDYWNAIATLAPDAGWDALVAMALQRLNLYAIPTANAPKGEISVAPEAPGKSRVVVLSRHGPRLVGGGEQFLRIAGEVYADNLGADVFFAGLSTDWAEARTDWPAGATEQLSLGFVYDDVEAFRAFCISNAVDVVHVISGLGEFVLDACRGLNVRIVYGVHFWREFIPARVLSRPYYPNVTLADAKPLESMNRLLERADYVYVNSDFCSDIAQTAYRWSPPIIYSVPVEEGETVPSASNAPVTDGYILLANARADKGWYLLLDIASRLPSQRFVAIASQSDRDAALVDVSRRGLTNVQVIDRTDRMDEMYRGAFLVLVPSFTFVETFSRVVIEAGRLNRPVLMADSGNLTYLGAGTDLVLPEDADAWSVRIARLAADRSHYADAIAQTASIAARHSAAQLRKSLRRIPVASSRLRVLVCIGSGIGNMCHTTPMIRRLADHFGVPIDVLAAGDFGGSSAVVAGSASVGQAFESYEHVAHRPYDLVFVTHSFGSVVRAFNAQRVIVSRDIADFDPAGQMHEAEFNLSILKQATGIAYSDSDLRGYFFGATARSARPDVRSRGKVAMHAGSKGGIWAAKRWPGYAQLAGRLIGDGYEVVSVGTTDEYVPATTDKTGLSIARMAEEISTCEAIVTNDSGVMNVANAMGVPIVAIFAPTNPVTRGPINSKLRLLTPNTDCSPCEAKDEYKARFEGGKCQCIATISVDDVMNALRSMDVAPLLRIAAE